MTLRHPPLPASLGVTVMPEWFACEGIEAVLDRVQALGASAIATSPYVLEPVPDGDGAREPPLDAGAGRVRPLDRPLFGRHELWVRTAPAFAHDFARYAGLRYQPSPSTALTQRYEDLLDRTLEACGRRGIAVLLQVMAASPPGYRVQFSAAHREDQCLLPDGRTHDARVDRNASLASMDVARYTGALVAELATRYPGVAGFRLDWPEYPPYDFTSALFDFNASACALMAARGHDPHRVACEAIAWSSVLRATVVHAASRGTLAKLPASGPWRALVDGSGPLAPLFAAKREAVSRLLQTVRRSLDDVGGERRRLELQAFPPPFHTVSGFPLDALHGVADAVGIKLYTMHWPMIARFWASDLVAPHGGAVEAVSAALAQAFGFVDAPVDGTTVRYPEPHEPHPVGAQAQREKIATAQAIAGTVPVMAFAHTYGPLDDVVARCVLARSTGRPLWLNRYGYLSDAKIAALAAALGEATCATSGR
jgi:hypothetical protein